MRSSLLVSLLTLLLTAQQSLCAPRVIDGNSKDCDDRKITTQNEVQRPPRQDHWPESLDTIYPCVSPDFETHSAPSLSPSDDEEEYTTPSRYYSTLLARRLLALSSTGTLSTIFPHNISSIPAYTRTPSSVAGISIGLPEYIADCEHNGNPTFIALGVSTSTKNVEFADTTRGRNVSLSISWWDQYFRLQGHDPWAVANLPRLSLVGYLEDIDEQTIKDKGIERCFVKKHRDSRLWLPGTKGAAHRGKWSRVMVEEVYWIGGFGG